MQDLALQDDFETALGLIAAGDGDEGVPAGGAGKKPKGRHAHGGRKAAKRRFFRERWHAVQDMSCNEHFCPVVPFTLLVVRSMMHPRTKLIS